MPATCEYPFVRVRGGSPRTAGVDGQVTEKFVVLSHQIPWFSFGPTRRAGPRRRCHSQFLYTTSSCGVCGKASLEAVRLVSRYRPAGQPASISASTLTPFPCQFRSAQKVFASTGGLHAAALFDLDGSMPVVRHHISPHNSV